MKFVEYKDISKNRIRESQEKLQFDVNWHRLVVQMNQRGVGLEQMSHSAAVRTFNVLMTEERPFWLILL